MANIIIKNFITKEEQQELLSIVLNNKDKMESYLSFNKFIEDLKRRNKTIKVHGIPLDGVSSSFIFRFNEETLSTNIIKSIFKRLEATIKAPILTKTTIFGSGLTYMFKGAEVVPHYDVCEFKKDNEVIVRMNIVIQSALEGGNFIFYNDDTTFNKEVIIPELAVMIFPASEVLHSVSRNEKGLPRVTLSVDTVVHKDIWNNLEKEVNE
jgi:hypothetical protein